MPVGLVDGIVQCSLVEFQCRGRSGKIKFDRSRDLITTSFEHHDPHEQIKDGKLPEPRFGVKCMGGTFTLSTCHFYG